MIREYIFLFFYLFSRLSGGKNLSLAAAVTATRAWRRRKRTIPRSPLV